MFMSRYCATRFTQQEEQLHSSDCVNKRRRSGTVVERRSTAFYGTAHHITAVDMREDVGRLKPKHTRGKKRLRESGNVASEVKLKTHGRRLIRRGVSERLILLSGIF